MDAGGLRNTLLLLASRQGCTVGIPHWQSDCYACASVRPKSVMAYSTLGGTSLKSCLVKIPSPVKSLRCWINTFSLMPSTSRLCSPNRCGLFCLWLDYGTGTAEDPGQHSGAGCNLDTGLAEPAEVAAAALFLASDDSSFVNRSELFVGGGAAQI